MPAKKTPLVVVSLLGALLALTVAAPAGASTTYGVAASAWSARFTFNGCEMRVKWGAENGSGVARARFYSRTLTRCSRAVEPSAGPGWIGAVAGDSGGLALVYPGKRQAGTHIDGCGRYVAWTSTAPEVTGLQVNLLNSGRLKDPFFRIAAHGRALPHAVRC